MIYMHIFNSSNSFVRLLTYTLASSSRMLLVVGLVTWLAVAVGDWAPSPAELLSRLPSVMLVRERTVMLTLDSSTHR